MLSWRPAAGVPACAGAHSHRVAVLVNPANAAGSATTLREVEAAARTIGLQIQNLKASTSQEIDAAFAELSRASGPTPSPFVPTPSSAAAVSIWPSWRCATRSPLRMRCVTMPKPAG